MTQAVPLYIVLIIVAAFAAAWLLHRWVRAIEESARRTLEASARLEAALGRVEKNLDELRLSLDLLRTAIGSASSWTAEKIQPHLEAVPKLLETVARVGNAQLAVAQQQRAEQQERERNPFGRANSAAPQRDVAAAEMEHEITQIMRSEGISREEAMLRMNPANTGSVWEGNGLLEGWRLS